MSSILEPHIQICLLVQSHVCDETLCSERSVSINQCTIRVMKLDTRNKDGKKALSAISLHTHTSNMILNHPTIKTNVHIFQILPLLCFRLGDQRSHIIPTHIIRKKPQTQMKLQSPLLSIPKHQQRGPSRKQRSIPSLNLPIRIRGKVDVQQLWEKYA